MIGDTLEELQKQNLWFLNDNKPQEKILGRFECDENGCLIINKKVFAHNDTQNMPELRIEDFKSNENNSDVKRI